MPDLLDQLRDQRTAVRTTQDGILTRAATEQRDLTPEELAEHTARSVEARELDDRIEALLADQVAELRAASTRTAGPAVPNEPVLSREQSVYDWLQHRGAFDQQAEPLSFDRYLRGIATANWDGAPHERALAEATVGAGGALVPAPLSARVIDLARNRTVVFRAGAQTVPMTSQTLALARLTSEGTPAWKSENATITAADMVFDRVTFTARTLVRLITLSVELFEDADPSSEDVIANAFAGQMAVELDRVALLGTGTAPEPRGGPQPKRRDPDRPRRQRHQHQQLRLVVGRHRRGAGGRVRAQRPHPGAAQLDQPEQAQRGHDQRLLGAAGWAAADADDQVGAHHHHHGDQHRHELCLHRRLEQPAGRHPDRLPAPVPGRALPRRQPAIRVPGLSARRRPAGPANRLCRRYGGADLMTERPIDADVAPGVEWAERGPDFERRVGEVAGVRGRPDPAAAELADDDVVVERKNLGPESGTFIAKGDPIPAELRGLPCRAARPAPSHKK